MIIRGQVTDGLLHLTAYSNEKGDRTPLASYVFTKPLPEVTREEMGLIVMDLRGQATMKYAQRRGLSRYTSKEVN